MSDIRNCTAEDIPAVARMFQSAFRDERKAVPASLESYLRELFLEHPWRDPETDSRVYVEADGSVRGFIGVLPLRMSFHGQKVRAALASSLVVDNPAERPLAGARLLRSYLTGPQELCVSETSNPVAQGMWERIGGRSIADYSMEWLRVIRPAGFGAAVAAEKLAAAKVFRPLARLADRVVARATKTFECPEMPAYYSDADVDDEALLEQIPRFAENYALHPDWDRQSLAFFLRHAAHKGRHGSLYRRMVYGRGKTPVGCYLYYGRPGGIAWVLQILALPEHTNAVFTNLLAHADAHGSVAVRGRTQPILLDALLRNRCVLFQRSSTTVYSSNTELMAAIRSGDALIVGLAGEGWTRLIGENFT
jgi:hypothetical protein